jgi:hypothetical protein
MTDSKRSGNSSLRSKLRGIKPAVIEHASEHENVVFRCTGSVLQSLPDDAARQKQEQRGCTQDIKEIPQNN